jgi:glycosyltransferase involved in cell wall biosynthesis
MSNPTENRKQKTENPAPPRLSVIMSVFNAGPYLRPAIDSVLAQTFRDFELVVVDDASTDNGRDIIDSYTDPRLAPLYNPANLGLSRSLNRAMAASRGELLARMDGDDISFPHRFAAQVDFLDRHPEVGVVGAAMEVRNPAGVFLYRYDVPLCHSLITWSIFFGRPLAHPTVMLRRACLEPAGGYDPAWRCEDLELWTRLADKTRFANLPDALYHYRSHPQSAVSRRPEEMRQHVLEVRRRFLSRLWGREADLELLDWLDRSQEPQHDLTPEQVRRVLDLILELRRVMTARGLFLPEEEAQVHDDMLARLMNAAGRPLPQADTGSRLDRLPRPLRLLAKAAAHPRYAYQVLKQRLTEGHKAAPAPEPLAAIPPAGPKAAAAEAPGLTVVVLSYERMGGLAALLESLKAQNLGGLRLELMVCNNSPRYHLKPGGTSKVGRLLQEFPDIKIFNSSFNWRCQVRYGLGTLVAHDTVMFLDDDITLLAPNFIQYMHSRFQTLGPYDLLSCWNAIWVEWTEDYFRTASLTFDSKEITELTQTDTIGPGISMFRKQVLLHPRILNLAQGFPQADDMAFPLVAALVWGSRSFFLPSYGMLTMHHEASRHELYEAPGHQQDMYAQFKALWQEGYEPVLSRDLEETSGREHPTRLAVRRLPAVQYRW